MISSLSPERLFSLFFFISVNIIAYASPAKKTDISYSVLTKVDEFEKFSDSTIVNEHFETAGKLDLGFYKGTIWVKVTIKNNDEDNDFIISNTDPINRTYRFYRLDSLSNALTRLPSGTVNFEDDRSLNFPEANFRISLKRNEEQTYFIYCKSDGRVLKSEFEVMSLDQYFSHIQYIYIENGFFYGAAFIILLINLFRLKNWKRKIYIYYSVFIVSTCLLYMSMEGYLFVLKENNYIIDHLIFFIVRIWEFALVSFTLRMFKIKEQLPKFDLGVKLLMGIIFGGYSLYQLMFIHSSVSQLHIIESASLSIWIVVILIIIAVSGKKRLTETKYYIFTLLIFLVFLIIGLICNHGEIISGNASTFLKIGTLFELGMFTYTISFVLMKKETELLEIKSRVIEMKREFEKDLREHRDRAKVLNDRYHKMKQSIDKLSNEGKINKSDLISIFKLLESNAKSDEEWLSFKERYAKLNPDFLPGLITKHPNLTKSEIRLLVLIKIGFSQKEISDLIGIASDSVKKSKQRVRKKMNLDRSTVLAQYIYDF